MATTAMQIFNTAMGFMDEVSTDGKTDTTDTAEYKNRTLLILNALRGELYPYSDSYDPNTEGGRPIADYIRDMNSVVKLDDYICQTIMPYGLAAHLLMDENPSAAAFFQSRYEELRNRLAVGIPAQSEDITDVYGGIEYGEFSRW